MRRCQGMGWRAMAAAFWLSSLVMPALAQTPPPATIAAAPEPEFVYRFQPRDTLIQVSRRLLLQPQRWPEVQRRNGIRDPFNIPPDTPVRIPYSWLRLTPDTATVLAVSGTVLRDGVPLAAGDVLTQGARIETGADGSVSIRFADQSVVTLQRSSVLRLERLRRVQGVDDGHSAELRLESGRAETMVQPKRDMGRFEIVTPVAISAVRGTRFRSGYDAASGHALAETLEGRVGVAAAQGAVSLDAGFGTRVEASGAVLPPVPLLPAPDLTSLPAVHGEPQLRLRFPALPGATSYRVQLAGDAQFRTLLVDQSVVTPQAELTIPADGAYWLRARGIDAHAIEGADAVHAFTQHVLPAAPSPTAPAAGARLGIGTTALQWSGPADAASYRLEVARDAQFADPAIRRDVDQHARAELSDLPPGTYHWRIAAVNAAGEAGAWSEPRSFTLRAPPPTPTAVRVDRRELRVTWPTQAGERYRVQLARDATFTRPVNDTVQDAGEFAVVRPGAGAWFVRVQVAGDGDGAGGGAGEFGAPQRFEVPLPTWLKVLICASVAVPALL